MPVSSAVTAAIVPDPFKPGEGIPPPHLAGREAEQSLFHGLLERLRRNRPVPAEVILYGPPGNGKTALLSWVETQIEADSTLDSVRITPSEAPDLGRLAQRLRIVSWFRRLSPESFPVADGGVSFLAQHVRPLLAEALEARAKASPLVILLDEAHTLDPGVGQLLLNAAQTAGRRAPLLLVLAGSPALHSRLSEMEASFWGRGEEVSIGRLGDEAAADAVRRPLAWEGVEVEPAALERIVRESHGSPFFLQVCGSEVWTALDDAFRDSPGVAPRVSPEIVDAAAPRFENRKGRYYRQRYEELDERALIPAARAVAAMFADNRALTDSMLDEVLHGSEVSGGPAPAEIEESLSRLGYIWRADADVVWKPGIPGLMDYLLEEEGTAA